VRRTRWQTARRNRRLGHRERSQSPGARAATAAARRRRQGRLAKHASSPPRQLASPVVGACDHNDPTRPPPVCVPQRVRQTILPRRRPLRPAATCCDLLRLLHGPDRVACRLLMILRSQQGWPAAQIADLLGYDPSTVRRWIRRYQSHRGRRPGRPAPCEGGHLRQRHHPPLQAGQPLAGHPPADAGAARGALQPLRPPDRAHLVSAQGVVGQQPDPDHPGPHPPGPCVLPPAPAPRGRWRPPRRTAHPGCPRVTCGNFRRAA
jgi:hypothetical protein